MKNETLPSENQDFDGLIRGDDEKWRCDWHGTYAGYDWYHDEEWGRPQGDDQRLFEKICLEGFQSGLSWLTILKKRENFRVAFHNFEIAKVANMGPPDVERLLQDAGIIRHRKKIESTINNAARALEMQSQFGSLAAWFWSFEAQATAERPQADLAPYLRSVGKTKLSTYMSKELKKLGWSFVGPTTVYAFMQAMGMVNDHLPNCCKRQACLQARAAFTPPALS